MDEEQDYPVLLRGAIDAVSSRRSLSFQFAEKTGNQQDSEYRALGKYLSGDETPNRERAAILAVLLNEPRLALVNDAGARRGDRLAKLEGEVATLRREFAAFVEAATERQAGQEVAPAQPMPRSDRRSSQEPGTS